MEQTAVEWFIEQVELISLNSKRISKEETIKLYNHAIQKAKKMEKEQLNIARLDGINLANKGYGKCYFNTYE